MRSFVLNSFFDPAHLRQVNWVMIIKKMMFKHVFLKKKNVAIVGLHGHHRAYGARRSTIAAALVKAAATGMDLKYSNC